MVGKEDTEGKKGRWAWIADSDANQSLFLSVCVNRPCESALDEAGWLWFGLGWSWIDPGWAWIGPG